MKKEQIERLKEIIEIAKKLNWLDFSDKSLSLKYKWSQDDSKYPVMQLSEVEKCMCAMVNDWELQRMQNWKKEVEKKK